MVSDNLALMPNAPVESGGAGVVWGSLSRTYIWARVRRKYNAIDRLATALSYQRIGSRETRPVVRLSVNQHTYMYTVKTSGRRN